jgi:glutamate dehydrogenase (NAD(P)+)
VKPPYLCVTWHDPVTGRPGYLVIDRLIDGAAGGGLRMRAGCTLDEVADLARAMTLKEAVAYDPGDRYTPFGGAKGGVDCDPYDPHALGVLRRYVEAMRPFLERHWATGEDFGVRQDTLDEIVRQVGLRSSIDAALLRLDDPEAGLARLRSGFAVDVDGIGLGEMVGGYGVAEAALGAIGRLGLNGADTRAVVQGFGSMGGATARGRHRRPPRARRQPRRPRRRAAPPRPRRPRCDRPRRAGDT